jgi:hypothetical protein
MTAYSTAFVLDHVMPVSSRPLSFHYVRTMLFLLHVTKCVPIALPLTPHCPKTDFAFVHAVALSQVMVRLQTVRWIALPTRRPRDPFRIAILLTMFWITVNCLIYYLAVVTLTKLILFIVVNAVLYLYYLANVIRTRLSLRRRFGILTARSSEDVMVGGLLPTLCVMQMLRHTCNYDTLAGYSLTATGLSTHVKLHLPPRPVPANDDYHDDDASVSTTTTLSAPLRWF